MKLQKLGQNHRKNIYLHLSLALTAVQKELLAIYIGLDTNAIHVDSAGLNSPVLSNISFTLPDPPRVPTY